MTQGVLISTPAQLDAAIRQAAFDYLAGWNEADHERLRRSLHSDLAKRGLFGPMIHIHRHSPPGDRLDELTAMRLIQLAPHDPEPEYNQWTEVASLDRLAYVASIKIGGDTGLGYSEMEWRIRPPRGVEWQLGDPACSLGLYLKGPDDRDEDAAITSTALDYIEDFYACDSMSIERTLHPALVRRAVVPDGAPPAQLSPGDYLYHLSAYVVQFVAQRGGPTVVHARRAEVTILDRVVDAASGV